jgi:hypothetical protein
MLEAQPLDGIGKLDIDADIERVALELDAGSSPPNRSTVDERLATSPSNASVQCP